MLRVLLRLALVTSFICITGAAKANGRFPQAQAIVSAPGGDGKTLFLRATFGILVSRDAGATWKWICERALGYTGEWDPPVAMTSDGRLWVGLEHGLAATKDGCAVETSPELANETVKDLTTDAKGEVLYALTGTPSSRGTVWRRTKAGAWQKLGQIPENLNALTIEVAPSRPGRIYVSAGPYGQFRGSLYHSDDDGKTWTGAPNDLKAVGPFFIADVDPKNADRVLIRHLHTKGSDLLVTTDAGKTFANVISMESAMFGFAKSSDGTTYWLGSGLDAHGIYESTDRGNHFERVAAHGVQCLFSAGGSTLFICENPMTFGLDVISVSSDSGKTSRPLAKFTDVQGAIACDDGGPSVCAEDWPAAQAQLTPPRPDAGPAPSSSAAKKRPSVTASGTDAAPKSSCGCSIIGAPDSAPDRGWLTMGLAPLFVWGLAHRRRGSRPPRRGA